MEIDIENCEIFLQYHLNLTIKFYLIIIFFQACGADWHDCTFC